MSYSISVCGKVYFAKSITWGKIFFCKARKLLCMHIISQLLLTQIIKETYSNIKQSHADVKFSDQISSFRSDIQFQYTLEKHSLYSISNTNNLFIISFFFSRMSKIWQMLRIFPVTFTSILTLRLVLNWAGHYCWKWHKKIFKNKPRTSLLNKHNPVLQQTDPGTKDYNGFSSIYLILTDYVLYH